MESAIPKSVQQQAEQAANLHKQRYGNPEDSAPEGNDDNLAPEKQDSQVDDLPAGEPERQPAEDKTESVTYWRHRFGVIQGKYDKEVPALQQQVRELTAEVDSLKASNEAGDNQRGSIAELTDDDIAAFSSDEIETIKKIARQNGMASSSEMDTLRQQVLELKQANESRKQESEDDAKATFWSKVEMAHPDVVSVNQDPNFIAFLQGINSVTGNQFNKDLRDAQARHDYTTVIEILTSFKRLAPAKPPREIPPEHVEQSTVRGSGGDLPESSKTYTRAEINAFYKSKAQGNKYTEEQARRIEADIFEAQKTGRIAG